MAKAKPDAATPRYYLLDMGREKYGDAILCLAGGKTILIDGGHPGDFDGQPGTKPLPAQITDVLGATPHLDLLVVTHCHLDHIGCLPKMIKNKVFTVDTALVADEKLGWGKAIAAPDSAVLPDSPIAARVVAALREEPRADDFESDAALERFLQDAVTLETTYKGMLKALADAGTKIIRYGRNSTAALVKEYAAAGLTILGPTKKHLDICRKAIATSMQDAIADTAALLNVDAAQSDVALYRRLAGAAAAQDALADGSRLGAALNNQSIIIALGPKTNRVLMTGDMQFSDPAVNGLDAEMTKLRKKVAAAGPYKFAKLAHHGSHNGFDESVRKEWGATKLFAVSGGSADTGHPAREILKQLKADTTGIKWARTDKNGRIELKPSNTSKPFAIAKGQLNDATANKAPQDERLAPVAAPAIIQRGPGTGPIEITARVPDGMRRVVITIESDGGGVSIAGPAAVPVSDNATLGGGRALPPLLFASNRKLLGDNIGKQEARLAIRLIEQAGQAYVDVPVPDKAQDAIHKQLTDDHRGVVLIGGYDILPAKRLDTLPSEVRDKLGDTVDTDADSFIVWSDSLYGDKDDDDLPELAVSRIPDGKSSQLVLNALTAQGVNLTLDRFSVFNSKRPFATDVIKQLPGLAKALASLPSSVTSLPTTGLSVPLVYFMLHGYDNDATRFAGQEPEYPDAFEIDQVPSSGTGVVFTGCCWGALTVRQIASRVTPGRAIIPRTPDSSIALRYLRAGYNAFIGCTGSHYSPPGKNMSHGKPMHVAFWKEIVNNAPPAEALFSAKKQYLKDMPHGMDDVWDIAVEHKILRQFTCLGLGW